MTAELIIGGLASGSLYALIGIAVVLVLQATDVPNFAQGEMAMFSTFVAYTMLNTYSLSWWIALPAAIAFAALQGIVVQQLIIRPLLGSPTINAVIATLGLNMALHSVAGMIWGNLTNVFTSPVADLPVFRLFGVNVSPDSALTILVSVAMIIVFTLILRHTRAGIALRAASQDQAVAKLMGISVSRSFALAWAMGSVAGLVAGILVAPILFLDVNLMAPLLIKGFAGAVLGGLSSLPGVFVGGLLLGVVENLLGAYVSGTFNEALSFILIIVVLIVAPAGIFGRVKSTKV
ncbi:branched-chain amino acid ABC-type transport system, permease component [Burkholderia sp. Ch1-1]|uniref:Branched-chain amino acid ABC-type transport system, permease component n=1 Tax=Paraburkholderia dioscoreae TaxID=2604047 RepID=A0A5Q4ZCI6_9BURK|nr:MULTISPECIES: branched-chain amino acid ABC transporter permease [Paraburkholderia]EIF31525.1 branched-chain amino acid ABC-type transport system, permease component [Burkholderia sp. Ch1-1]MDR8398151.1 branched-chain amino acid ABC transporter permease [Paraburkholderia sp. USG1]VVD28217.1 Branched-chain amino acid ABC-type transport system, permease component [Paraburkholderia dioscoreae]